MDRPIATSRVRSQKGKGVNVPRRFWTSKEEESLLVCLEILHGEGMKLHGTLRGGYLIRLENMIGEMLPGCGIKHKHVKSKLSVWRKTHTAIITILSSSGGGGFTMDPTTHMLIADKPDAWEEQEKVYKEGVKLVRGKSFPHLQRWNVLFGTDRASGNQSVDVGDAINELLNSSKNEESSRGKGLDDSNQLNSGTPINLDEEEEDATSVTPPTVECNESQKSSTSRRRSLNVNPIEINKLVGELMESTRISIGDAAEKMLTQPAPPPPSRSDDDAAKQADLYNVLSTIPELSLDAVMWATEHLAIHQGQLRAFYGMPTEVRGMFVLSLINHNK